MTITAEELIARAEILEALHNYAQAQDQDNWALFESVFADEATVEMVGLSMGTMSAQAMGAFLKDTFNATRLSGQHLIGNVIYKISGESAQTVAEVLHHTLQYTDEPGVLKRSQGTTLYTDTWAHTSAGWRITQRTVTQKHLEEDTVTYAPQLLSVVEAGKARVAALVEQGAHS